ncbi:fungal-specific transcription factor domain-containing protein [Penicillium verhagenii]|uniref:fungal-specific transcription factor domain-containing protein n=1 Tax=Penicillium verhagenii TaxID=1562060 RepID=UPI002544EA2D|nr:fungal-specific transcription factor domain-containing protein [Penicillium verhagenii]KAJ5928395.1 fungal-specific transcription factor domain-containing protein [Penicillium verhagenii]
MDDIQRYPSSHQRSRSQAPKRPRTRPSCKECRCRKLRSDGQQPQYSMYHELKVVYETTERGSRGPKKGYIKALEDRFVYLEALLENPGLNS